MALRCVWSRLGIVLSSLGVSTWGIACSAPPGAGDDADDVPEYVGQLPSAAPGTPAAPPAANAPPAPTGSTNPTPTPEVIGSQPSGVPIDNSNTNGSNTNNPSSSSAGAGGSASVSPTEPPPSNGAGGSAMPSAAGSGNMPPDDGQTEPPPVTPPPVTPPPVTPPPVTPPPVTPPPVQPPSNPGPVGSGCGNAAFFCEDFEDLAVGTVQATNGWRPEGTLSIDGQVAQGTRSLHLQPNGGQFSRITLSSFAPPNNSFFGRMKVFVERFPTAPAFSHFVFVEVTGAGGERVRPIGGQFIPEGNGPSTYWGVGSDAGATGDWTKWEPRVLTENGRWICMEWRMNAADSSVDIFIDGTERPELGVDRTNHGGGGSPFVFPTFNSIWFGWWNFQGGTTPAQFNVWLDDLVLSSERVGCN